MNWILGVRDKERSLVFAGATGKSQCQSQRQDYCRSGVGEDGLRWAKWA